MRAGGGGHLKSKLGACDGHCVLVAIAFDVSAVLLARKEEAQNIVVGQGKLKETAGEREISCAFKAQYSVSPRSSLAKLW